MRSTWPLTSLSHGPFRVTEVAGGTSLSAVPHGDASLASFADCRAADPERARDALAGRDPGATQLQEVVDRADQAPLAQRRRCTASREAPEAQVGLDVAEDRFGGDFALGVAGASLVGSEPLEHRLAQPRWIRTARPPVVAQLARPGFGHAHF